MTRASITIAMAAIAVVGLLARHAAAEDSVGTADTIASTWSGGVFRLAERDHSFALTLTTLLEGVRIRGQISAPLDSTTRRAVFREKGTFAPAFRGSLHIGYDSTYKALDLEPEDGKLLQYCKAQKIEPCTASAVAEHKKKAAGPRRRNGQPIAGAAHYWALGLDLAYAYDRTTAYVGDISDNMMIRDFRATNLQVGGSYMRYVPGGWVLTARGGYERSNPVNIGDFRLCQTLDSSNPTMSGQACSDAQYLISDPDVRATAYGRVSGTYYPTDSVFANYLSAAELRVNFEKLTSDDASLDVHLLLFAKGIDLGGGSARFGIGTTVSRGLSAPVGADVITKYSLFGIAGTSF
jgi:hypothetical protein